MKIWGDIPKVSGVYGNSNKVGRSAKAGEISSRKDELTISGAAKDFSVVMKALRQVPDVRMDRVSEISRKIERGEYSVSGRDVADKILNKKI